VILNVSMGTFDAQSHFVCVCVFWFSTVGINGQYPPFLPYPNKTKHTCILRHAKPAFNVQNMEIIKFESSLYVIASNLARVLLSCHEQEGIVKVKFRRKLNCSDQEYVQKDSTGSKETERERVRAWDAVIIKRNH
jgi:hypothetical protein